jgi:Protein of unknown function (DUF3168)
MSEPSLELQGAMVTALKADAALDALIVDRIYDRVPPAPTFPYITVGDDQVISAHADCLEGSTQIFATLHAWSRKPGMVETKRISGAIVTALNAAALPLNGGYRLVLLEHDSTQFLIDPDGLTSHAVIVFHALIDEI